MKSIVHRQTRESKQVACVSTHEIIIMRITMLTSAEINNVFESATTTKSRTTAYGALLRGWVVS